MGGSEGSMYSRIRPPALYSPPLKVGNSLKVSRLFWSGETPKTDLVLVESNSVVG